MLINVTEHMDDTVYQITMEVQIQNPTVLV